MGRSNLLPRMGVLLLLLGSCAALRHPLVTQPSLRSVSRRSPTPMAVKSEPNPELLKSNRMTDATQTLPV